MILPDASWEHIEHPAGQMVNCPFTDDTGLDADWQAEEITEYPLAQVLHTDPVVQLRQLLLQGTQVVPEG